MTPKDAANFVIDALVHNKHSAYLVGGCVRDSILGVPPKDFDIATSARPEEVISLFTKVIPTGIKHGTVTVMVSDVPVEVTTFRTEGVYTDARHPDHVEFVRDVKEDLSRRDFTINAIAMNAMETVDPFGGRLDIQGRIIRCVGDPNERFSEDPLRMMRAIRFACRLGFHIEEKTMEAIKSNAGRLVSVSNERIRDEFTKTLVADSAKGLMLLHETGLIGHVIPEAEHSITIIVNSNKVPATYHMAGLLIGFEEDYEICGVMRRMKFSSVEIDEVCNMVAAYRFDGFACRDAGAKSNDAMFRRFAAEFTHRGCLETVMDFLGSIGMKSVRQNVERVMKSNPCISIKGLAINGEMLSAMGFKGKKIGETLKEMLAAVLVEPALNTKEHLVQLCEKKILEAKNSNAVAMESPAR